MPEKKYEFAKNYPFVNPYNFVPTNFTQKTVPPQKTAETFTGWLDCRLTAKTPLAIPNTEDNPDNLDDKEKHKTYSFSNINDTPYIAGSSVRGVIRSIFETVTNSCYSTATAQGHIDYRSKDPFSPGLLYKKENGEYVILPATRYAVRKDDPKLKKLHYGQGVIFTYHQGKNKMVVDTFSACSPGKENGYVCIGEPFVKKEWESFFKPNQGAAEIPVSEEILQAYLGVLKLYCDPVVNRATSNPKDFYKDRHNKKFTADFFEVGKYYPIWYCSEQIGRTYSLRLSPAQIGRTETYKNFDTLLNERKPCTNKRCACPACTLFGMVGKMDKDTGENNSIASRVRFTDAGIDKNEGLKFVTLQELAGPHASYMPFYAEGGTDYDKGATFRGRKFYWHNPAAATNEAQYRTTDKTKRNATMELLQTGSSFTFRVYYDNITKDELQKLLWSLTLGDNQPDSPYCQKIGHGKPLGLGSVKITVEKNTQRTFANGYNLAEVPADIPALQTETAKNLLIICNFNAQQGQNVRYPYVEKSPDYRTKNLNDTASHQWFTSNWKLGNKSIPFPLPKVTDVQTLYAAVHKSDPMFSRITPATPAASSYAPRNTGNYGGSGYGGNYGNNRNNYGNNFGSRMPKPQPAEPAEQPIKKIGFCDDCGKPTKPDKNGNPRRYCGICQNKHNK